MPRGSAKGERRGGRKEGTANKRTREIADQAAATGLTPLEYMIQVMRDDGAEDDRRDDMAKAAAPYMHPRLASTEIKGNGPGGSLTVRVELVKPNSR